MVDRHTDRKTNRSNRGREVNRRSFLSACTVGAVGVSTSSAHDDQNEQVVAPPAPGTVRAIDFSRSYLYCAPKGSGIWVRSQIECRCMVRDHVTGRSSEYILSVVAKTGLNRDPQTDARSPGYDYWIIFSDQHVYTRRTHTSSYFNNPTTLPVDEFGMAKWRLQQAPAVRLRAAGAVRRALEAWRPIVARSMFSSTDGSRSVAVDYPVKWADFHVESDGFRVETGPIVLLDPDKVHVDRPPKFADFQWSHVDYRSFDRVRCLLDRPTPILTGADFTPPAEHGREQRESKALTAEQVARIQARLEDWPETPIGVEAMRKLLRTDHYSEVVELPAATELYALDAPNHGEPRCSRSTSNRPVEPS